MKSALIAALALASSGEAPAPASDPPAAGNARYAIVVGHNGGNAENAALRFADDDAARMYLQLLPSVRQAWLLTTFDATTAASFPDLTEVARPPSARELARVLGELNWGLREHASASEGTELVFYFAGHGDVDAKGEGFLLLADGPFTRTSLQRQLVEGSVADVNHLILDACASYFMAPRRGGNRARSRKLEAGMLDALEGDRVSDTAAAKTGVLVSTADASDVHESAEVGGGVFSYLLRSALAGAADLNGDGRVEYAEAAGFITSASATLEDPAARVRVHARAPRQRPHAPLVDLGAAKGSHFLVIDGGGDRHVRVMDSRGVPYAEVRSAADRVALTLVGSPYFVVQVGDREAVLVPRRAGAYALSALEFGPHVAPRSAGASRFAGLFQEPFTPAFLRGYLAGTPLPAPLRGPPLALEYAAGYDEPLQVPWTWLGGTGLGIASLAAAGALAASAGNIVAFVALQESFNRTRYLDPGQALAVEIWRGAALGLTATAVLFAVGGASLVGVGILTDEEGEP